MEPGIIPVQYWCPCMGVPPMEIFFYESVDAAHSWHYGLTSENDSLLIHVIIAEDEVTLVGATEETLALLVTGLQKLILDNWCFATK